MQSLILDLILNVNHSKSSVYIHLILTVNKPNNDPDKGCINVYSRFLWFYQLFALEYFLNFSRHIALFW